MVGTSRDFHDPNATGNAILRPAGGSADKSNVLTGNRPFFLGGVKATASL